MNPGIYGLGASTNTPIQGPFADPRKALFLQLLVVGGGGAGSGGQASSRTGPGGGGGGIIESSVGVVLGITYTVQIGAGGAVSNFGNLSRFGDFTAAGGGWATTAGGVNYSLATGPGGLGARFASVIPSQGAAGGTGVTTAGGVIISGGGGGGSQGGDATTTIAGSGGAGRTVSILAVQSFRLSEQGS